MKNESVLAPTEKKEDVVKGQFYDNMGKVCDSNPSYDMKMIAGDFNA